ncbi:Fc.00g048310.m01.CDS01 [Cosmosporella sp. VM-42]
MERADDDANNSLREIASQHGRSIISLMIDIQHSKLEEEKILSFLGHLECLGPNDGRQTMLSRRWVNGFENRDFVALSYTWDRSVAEDPATGQYEVETRDGNNIWKSPIRDCIFNRILRYMRAFRLDLLWMDRHCIKQKRCDEIDCDHRACKQKRVGLQAMGLVYKLSNHPVA